MNWCKYQLYSMSMWPHVFLCALQLQKPLKHMSDPCCCTGWRDPSCWSVLCSQSYIRRPAAEHQLFINPRWEIVPDKNIIPVCLSFLMSPCVCQLFEKIYVCSSNEWLYNRHSAAVMSGNIERWTNALLVSVLSRGLMTGSKVSNKSIRTQNDKWILRRRLLYFCVNHSEHSGQQETKR